MIPVRIKCDESTIRKIARFTAIHYRQRAVLVYKVSDFCFIIENFEAKREKLLCHAAETTTI